jgi:carboxyl-terminal processing protease
MPRFRTAAVVGALSIPLLAGAFMLQTRPRGAEDTSRLFGQVFNLVSERFVDTLDTSAMYEKAARGLVSQLNDPYAALYSPKQLRDFTASTGGRYGGVGMLVEPQNGQVVVSRVFPNTPAEAAQIMEGDRIVAVNDSTTLGLELEQVTEKLKGVPGTKVRVTFQRPGVTQPIKATFSRAIIRIPSVPYALMLDNKIGYIPLLQFNETSADELRGAIERLGREGARGYVVDMRDNGGGIVDQALAISNYFLRPGLPLMSVRGRESQPQVFVASERPIVPDLPLVVLTDGGSASATEIVAGALQDHDRALIVGTSTFGKGLEQGVFHLDGGWALKLTTAKWFTPSGRSIHRDRKLVAGRLMEIQPDSLESDTVKKSRPTYRSTAGRTIYGGGGITPDVIVQPDTLTSAEQQFTKAIAPKGQDWYLTVYNYAWELKAQPGLRQDFTVTAEQREELYRRLQKAGLTVDKKLYDQADRFVSATLANRVAHFAWGDSIVRRRTIPDDVQLKRALELMRQGHTQQELFRIATKQN